MESLLAVFAMALTPTSASAQLSFARGVGAHTKPNAALAAAAERNRATPGQMALAWLLARSPVMLPIPGTSRPEHLEENWGARSIHLEPNEVESIAAAARQQ